VTVVVSGKVVPGIVMAVMYCPGNAGCNCKLGSLMEDFGCFLPLALFLFVATPKFYVTRVHRVIMDAGTDVCTEIY
jgi:ABC-type polysaccharide/polyol phosphate export permease